MRGLGVGMIAIAFLHMLQVGITETSEPALRTGWDDPLFLMWVGAVLAMLTVTVYLIIAIAAETKRQGR